MKLMKKSIILLFIIFLLLIIGIVLTIQGCIVREDNTCDSICSSIGTGLIASTIVSLVIEFINMIVLSNNLKKLEKVFFKPYIHSFDEFRDALPSINDLYHCDGKSHDFSEYVGRLLDVELYDDKNIYEDIIFELEHYLEKIKHSVEFLISQEFEIVEISGIHSKFPELKKQRATCNRILGNLRNQKYSDAITNIIKLKNRHLILFPSLTKYFDDPYANDDQD